jgi:hypothetical protein
MNHDNGRSVEHLIPNTILRSKSKNSGGDFYACRRCNARKSHIDYVLGVVAKTQSRDSDFGAEALLKAATSDDKRSARFVKMLQTAQHTNEGVQLTVPILGTELLEYVRFLGKGQYFKQFGVIFQPAKQVMLVAYCSKDVHSALESSYEAQHGSNPYRDLEKNKYSEVLSGGDCIIYSKNANFLFIFHDYTSVIIRIKRRNRKTAELEKKQDASLIKDFE